jgi:cyclophilin family peptidyl-prolyl cis-trans isomerase/chitodextrinase
MKYRAIFAVIFSISAIGLCAGASCDSLSAVLPAGIRPAPVIIPAGNPQNSFSRTYSVDLRAYPEAASLTWEYGDGSESPTMQIAAGKTISHTYVRGGTFNVQVHLFSGMDIATGEGPKLITTGRLPVQVTGPNTKPTASFIVETVTDGTGTPQSLVRRFNAGNSRDPDGSIVSFDWDFGDSTTDSGQTIEHTFARSGRFTVRLTVTDDRGATASFSRNIVLNESPTSDFTFAVSPGDPLTFTFDGTSSADPDGAISAFSWNFGDNSPTASDPIVTHTYATPGDFTVTLTVTDETGTTASSTQSLDVTGEDPFVRSVTPRFGVLDSTSTEFTIDGENFTAGATVALERAGTTITATNVSFVSATTLQATFGFSGVQVGDYSVRVSVPGTSGANLPNGLRVVTANRVRLTTTLGEILIELVADAPVTTQNYLQYVEDGFYNGTIFHRVVPGFVVQGGGFLPGGTQKPGVRPPIVNEFSPSRSNLRGTLAMAKLGNDPDSATCQFFFNLADNSENLDNQNGGFTVFATVIEGLDVVDAIAAVQLNGETPVTDVIITTADRE